MLSALLILLPCLSTHAYAADPAPVLTQVQGLVQLLEPVKQGGETRPEHGTLAKFGGKLVNVIEAKAGDPIPNGSIIQTFAGSKAKVVFANGNALLAGAGSRMGLSWKQSPDGKTTIDVDLKSGLIHGIIQKSDDTVMKLATKAFTAIVPGADFFLGVLDSIGVKDAVAKAASGAFLKVVSGLASLWPFGGSKKDSAPVEVPAGTEVAVGAPPVTEGVPNNLPIPFLNAEQLRLATTPEGGIASERDQKSDLIAAALGKNDPQSSSKAASCDQNPVLSQIQGRAQIVKQLMPGILRARDALPGDCVENGSYVRTAADSKGKIIFPNGDQLFAGENTQLGLKWAGNKLGISLGDGTIRGVFASNQDRVVSVITKTLKTVIPGADFVLSTLEKLGILDPGSLERAAGAVVGAVFGTGLKVLSGLAKLWPFGGSSDESPVIVEAGKKVVVADAEAANIPLPQSLTAPEIAALKTATTPDPAQSQPVPASRQELVAAAEKRSLAVAEKVAPTEARHPAPPTPEWKEDSSEPEQAAHKRYVDPKEKTGS